MQDMIKAAQRRRYEFLEFQLLWEGSVGRKALSETFEISMQQATLDLTRYMDLAPGNMTYDPRQRSYVAESRIKPKFISGSSQEYLLRLDMLNQGYVDSAESWIASQPPSDFIQPTVRAIDPNVLRATLKAIRHSRVLEATYISLSSDSEAVRRLFPHAIASDGHRWHMRAYDMAKNRFSDFVLSRLESAKLGSEEADGLPEDSNWQQIVPLELKVSEGLSERQRSRVELEYGMEQGSVCLEVRQAMLFYYLRHFGFDPYEREAGTIRNKSSFSLSIVNLEEVERCLGRRN